MIPVSKIYLDVLLNNLEKWCANKFFLVGLAEREIMWGITTKMVIRTYYQNVGIPQIHSIFFKEWSPAIRFKVLFSTKAFKKAYRILKQSKGTENYDFKWKYRNGF